VPGKGCFISENAIEIIGNFKRLKLNELSNTLTELKLANITKEEILALIDSVYNERS
jgi:GntR family transcriptional regulator